MIRGMSRPRHPDKDIERAVKYAESQGWRFKLSRGHAWGHLYCPGATRDGCRTSVWSTPAIPRGMLEVSGTMSISVPTFESNSTDDRAEDEHVEHGRTV